MTAKAAQDAANRDAAEEQAAAEKAAAEQQAAEEKVAADKAAAEQEAAKPRARTAQRYVTVHTSDAGSVTYAAGDKIPGEHVALISNPKVWSSD